MNDGIKLTYDDFKELADKLGCEVEVIQSFVKTETGGKSVFLDNMHPKILFERHHFRKYTNERYDKSHPDISVSQKQAGKYGGSELQWTRLAKAYALDPVAAISACSWGAFQVMGVNYKAAGYKTVQEFAQAMCRSEKAHLNLVHAWFKINSHAIPFLKAKNWAKIAREYNGPGYAKNKYDIKLEQHYNEFIELNKRRK